MSTQRKMLLAVGAVAALAVLWFLGGPLIGLALPQPDLRMNSAFMKKAHQARRLRPEHEKNPYTFDYKDTELGIEEKDSRRCVNCHGDMLDKKADGRPKYPIHYAMLTANKDLMEFHCTDCHKTVDLGPRSRTKVTMRINRRHCARCHESNKRVEGLEADILSKRMLISDHGFDKQAGMWWLKNHLKVAPKVGGVQCYRCHAPGSELDFCNQCHKGRHPKDWKGRHFVVARAEGTIKCRVCHAPGTPMDFCSERCHGKPPNIPKLSVLTE